MWVVSLARASSAQPRVAGRVGGSGRGGRSLRRARPQGASATANRVGAYVLVDGGRLCPRGSSLPLLTGHPRRRERSSLAASERGLVEVRLQVRRHLRDARSGAARGRASRDHVVARCAERGGCGLLISVRVVRCGVPRYPGRTRPPLICSRSASATREGVDDMDAGVEATACVPMRPSPTARGSSSRR